VVVNPLLDHELTPDQRAVLSVIHGELEENVRWPIWQYIDFSVKPYGAAVSAYSSLPGITDTRQPRGLYYGYTWTQRREMLPSPGTEVALTVAGLYRLSYDDLPRLYVKLLRYCVEEQTKLKPSPTAEVYVTLQFSDMLEVLLGGYSEEDHRSGHSRKRLRQLGLLANNEPPTAGRVIGADQAWSLQVPSDIVQYAEVDTVEDYLNHVVQSIEPAPIPFARSSDSPYSIPEAISFLDAVWTRHVGEPLFGRIDPSGVASLLSDAHTPDEFDSRCSALADVLAQIVVPPDPGLQRKGVRPVVLLGQWFARQSIPEGVAGRLQEATSVLSRIVNIRVGGQHHKDRRKTVAAFQEFGLDYPPSNWTSTWGALRQSAVNALDAIRQEVAANFPTDSP
jgi:hypothetical protein